MAVEPAVVAGCCARLYELPITRILLGQSFHPGGPKLTRRLADLAVVGRHSSVLDVASGTGESARVLAASHGCKTVGLDLSADNVARATRLTEEAGLTAFARFVQGDAEALPCGDGEFDVVMCECALCTFPNMEGALAEMHRALVDGGRLALSDVVLEEPPPKELEGVMGHVLCIAGAESESGYVAAVEAAGFVNVRFRDAPGVLLEMLDGIERRAKHAQALADVGELDVPEELGATGEVVAAARDFVRSGGVRYALITARKRARA